MGFREYPDFDVVWNGGSGLTTVGAQRRGSVVSLHGQNGSTTIVAYDVTCASQQVITFARSIKPDPRPRREMAAAPAGASPAAEYRRRERQQLYYQARAHPLRRT